MRRLFKKLFGFTFFILTLSLPVQAGTTRETILQLLKEYSPSGYYLVTQSQALPEKRAAYWNSKKIDVPIEKPDFMKWVQGDTEKDILTSLGTVVHEMCHQYSYNMAYVELSEQKIKVPLDENYEAFYNGADADIFVKKIKVFNSREIAETIPESLRTLRYTTYISGKKISTSQTDGVFGLMNELNAYYFDMKTSVEMYPYYRDKMKSGIERWLIFFYAVNSVRFAYPEFKFFFLKYLLYAKKHYPAQYRDIINNQELIRAFFTLDKNFSSLNSDYSKITEEVYESLRRDGNTVSEDGSDLYIKGPSGNKKIYLYLKEYNLLQDELAKEEYQSVLKELEK